MPDRARPPVATLPAQAQQETGAKRGLETSVARPSYEAAFVEPRTRFF